MKNFLRDEGEDDGRVIVFATKRNLEMLKESKVWFMDGTYKVCILFLFTHCKIITSNCSLQVTPTLFTQLFTVVGLVTRHNKSVALPFVYGLLSSKQTYQYSTVLHAITAAADDYNIPNCEPEF